jgi:hypothetical protein
MTFNPPITKEEASSQGLRDYILETLYDYPNVERRDRFESRRGISGLRVIMHGGRKLIVSVEEE